MEEILIKYINSPELTKLGVGDWVDLYTAEDIDLKNGEFKLIPLGVCMKLPDGYEAHVAPRSSTFKKWGVLQTNGVGIIDGSYCGDSDEWMFPALACRDTSIPKGTRICQFRIVKRQEELKFTEVNHLPDKSRGGFGSTGER